MDLCGAHLHCTPLAPGVPFGATVRLRDETLNLAALPQTAVSDLMDALFRNQILVLPGLGKRLSMTENVSFSKQLGVVDPEVSRARVVSNPKYSLTVRPELEPILGLAGPPRYVDEGVHVSANTETAKSGRVVRQSSIIAARAAQIAAGEPLEIFKVVTEPDDPLAFGEGWHTDLTFLQTPPLAAVLIARQPSSQGTGKTLFLSAFAAYDALSDHTRAALHNCHALHTDQAGRNVWHPAVNHIGGRTGLFVNRHFTKSQ